MLKPLLTLLATFTFGGLLACGGTDDVTETNIAVPTVDEISAEEWARLRQRRVFFGHQSVGNDILAGVADLAKDRPEFALRVVETADPAAMTEPGIYHALVGKNGAPETKLQSFVQIASAAVADSGTALLKYCYIDVTEETDPARLFEEYQREVGALRTANPELRILHVTLPLQTDWGEYFHWKRVIRGKLTTHRELNSIRQAYNERLRVEYAGREPIFDLARLQSISPAGTISTVRYWFKPVPILDRAWTHDGGHLNEAGRRRIAEAFLVALAKM